jgi:uncharacterized protein (TIGR03437 family)
MSLFKLLSGLAIGACLLPGQSTNVVINSGYRAPSPLKVAPGQVITLFVRPASIRLTSGVAATSTPLPVTLGGFSATLRQTFSPAVAVPIFSVNPIGNCPAVSVAPVCSYLAAVTVQIPFELIPNAERSRLPQNFASLTVAENNVDGDPLQLNPVAANLHIVTSCDSTLAVVSPPCLSLVKKSDGTVVTPKFPAVPGETVTISAYGLGGVAPVVKTGELPAADATSSAPATKIGIRFGTNPAAAEADTDPASTVLTREAVGLYAVSFQVPEVPQGTPACSEAIGFNMSVTVARGSSSGTVDLCVRVPQQ